MRSQKGKGRQTRNEEAKEGKAFRKVRQKKEYLKGRKKKGEKKRGKKEN